MDLKTFLDYTASGLDYMNRYEHIDKMLRILYNPESCIEDFIFSTRRYFKLYIKGTTDTNSRTYCDSTELSEAYTQAGSAVRTKIAAHILGQHE